MQAEQVHHAAAFWTMNYDSVLSRVIARLTDGPFSHMGVAFYDCDGRGEYFESLRDEGFVGPRPVDDLIQWGAQKHHKVRIVRLPCSDIAASRMYETARGWSRADTRIHYPKTQLFMMALHERYRIPVPTSTRRAVCSEIVTRLCLIHSVLSLVAKGTEVDFRDFRRTKADMVNPNSAWRRMCEMAAGLEESRIGA
jgi:hypothetical protein